jgi:hypothetical protein
MANSTSTYPNLSLLQWPFNPTGHFVSLAGRNNSIRTSHTALVYEHGALPIPWSYALVSVVMPWIPAFLGSLGVDKVNTEGKPGFFSRLRKPGIVYNAFHTIAVIILCARARQTRTVPSNLTTGSVTASLMGQLVGWEETFDLYSLVTVLCTVVLFCPNIYQMVLRGALGATGDLPYAFGYGAIRLIGGNCPWLLENHEDCKNLIASGCGEGSGVAGDLLRHVRAIGMFQAYVGMVITTIIGPLMPYVLWHVLNCKSHLPVTFLS